MLQAQSTVGTCLPAEELVGASYIYLDVSIYGSAAGDAALMWRGTWQGRALVRALMTAIRHVGANPSHAANFKDGS